MSNEKSPPIFHSEYKQWHLKNMRWVTNKTFGSSSAWIINTLSIKEMFVGLKCPAAKRITVGLMLYSQNNESPNRQLLEAVFNNKRVSTFQTMEDDKISTIKMDNYFALSEYARFHKFRINLRKGRLEDVKEKTNE